jgi:hypothetical protein
VPAKLESFKALMFKYYPEFYQKIQCEPLEIQEAMINAKVEEILLHQNQVVRN